MEVESLIPEHAPGGVQLVSADGQLDLILERAGNRLVAIDAFADWCGPCTMIAPVFAKLAEEHPEIVFVKVDVEAAPGTAKRLGVQAMPSFFFYKNSLPVGSFMGASPKALRLALRRQGRINTCMAICCTVCPIL